MTLYDLLNLPTMRRSEVLAGRSGLNREVLFCAPSASAEISGGTMPGTLYLLGAAEVEPDTVARLFSVNAAGLVIFGDDVVANEQTLADFDECGIPLVREPRGTNAVTFMKRFAAEQYRSTLEETRAEDWLRAVCDGYMQVLDEMAARKYGYNSDYGYYCMLMRMKGRVPEDSVVRDMEFANVRNLIARELSFEDAPVLSYGEDDEVVAFVPWPNVNENDMLALRHRINQIVIDARRRAVTFKWYCVIGGCAESLSEFHDSYIGALRIGEVTHKLGVHQKVGFYDDWYMHMLLLKEPRGELQEHMEHTLAPIMGSPELVETLACYLVFGENLKLTAEKMFIHVNTLKYRLKRISDLLGVDLKDPNTRFRLRMAVTIERYLRAEE